MVCRFQVLRAAGGGWTTRLTLGDQPALETPFTFDVAGRLADVLQRIEDNKCAKSDLKDVGSQLWNALLGPMNGAARTAFQEAAAGEGAQQVWLDLPADQRLLRLPWEAMFDEWQTTFLASDPRYILLRAPEADIPAPDPVEPSSKLRILVVVPAGSQLQTHFEWNNLKAEEKQFGAELDIQRLDGRVSAPILRAKMREGWDVVHYIGHGELDLDGGATIRLNTSDGDGEQWVDGQTFAALFVGANVRLALLNCCYGAAPAVSVSRSLYGIGPHLMRTARVPNVIAMRYEIPDAMSIRFAETFYRELLNGAYAGRVDRAAQAARESLFFNAAGEGMRSFVTPVVMATPGRELLFRPAERRKAPRAPEAAKGRAPSASLPEELVASLREERCVPIIGPGIHQAVAARGAPALGVRQLVAQLAKESNFDDAELRAVEQGGDWLAAALLARICQQFERRKLWNALLRLCGQAPVPAPLTSVARWKCPGIVYTHFDDMMERALLPSARNLRVINGIDAGTTGEATAPPVLVNLRGSLKAYKALVLSDSDHEQFLVERLARTSSEVVDLFTGHPNRTFLLLGVSPSDPLVRRFCKRYFDSDPNSNTMQGPKFFVEPRPTAVDLAYWEPIGVEWLKQEPEQLIDALTDAVTG